MEDAGDVLILSAQTDPRLRAVRLREAEATREPAVPPWDAPTDKFEMRFDDDLPTRPLPVVRRERPVEQQMRPPTLPVTPGHRVRRRAPLMAALVLGLVLAGIGVGLFAGRLSARSFARGRAAPALAAAPPVAPAALPPPVVPAVVAPPVAPSPAPVEPPEPEGPPIPAGFVADAAPPAPERPAHKRKLTARIRALRAAAQRALKARERARARGR